MSRKKLYISSVMFEATRKCNMQCDHCMRGDAQNISMKKEYMDSFLENVDHIQSLGFTGGEPTLPDGLKVMNDFADIAEEKNIRVDDFWIITNGKVWTDEIGTTLERIHGLVKDPIRKSTVEISRDQFHNSSKIQRDVFSWNLEKMIFLDSGGIERQKFKILQRSEVLPDKHILKMGRSIKTGVGHAGFTFKAPPMNYNPETVHLTGGNVYVNCKGNVIWGCDWSYRQQDIRKNVIICSVKDDLHQKVNSYFNKEMWKDK